MWDPIVLYLWWSCIRKAAQTKPPSPPTHIRPLVTLLCHNLLKRRYNRKPEVGQPQGVQWDVTPSSKRLCLFKAVVETPCLDLHNIFITFSRFLRITKHQFPTVRTWQTLLQQRAAKCEHI